VPEAGCAGVLRDMEREEREKAGRYEAARKIKEELAAEV
jgi:hypothetical protein